ncbi:MAG: hypothetical protein ACPGXZ_00845 [Saprospiraceae bacterium]
MKTDSTIAHCKHCKSFFNRKRVVIFNEKTYCSTDCLDNAIDFDYVYVKGFGWENTIYIFSDFKEVNQIAVNDDGTIYEGIFDNGVAVLLKTKKSTK